MAGWTNRGKQRLLEMFFQDAYDGGGEPTNFYVALVTEAKAPDADFKTLSQLTEVAAGNGYTSGGYQLSRDATDFDVLEEKDEADRAIIQIKDVSWTASGGAIPTSGDGPRYAVLTDDNATVADREVLAFWDLGANLYVNAGSILQFEDLELQVKE